MWSALAAALLVGSAPATPAPPGPVSPPSRIVFASARTGVAQLYSVEPSGAGIAQLTFGAGNWGFPVPSPDGRFLAAFRAPDLKGWLVWSPNGRWIAIRDRDTLTVVRATGGVVNAFSAAPSYCILACMPPGVAWSPDSRRLAFETDQGIELAAPSRAKSKLLVKGLTEGLAWSPR